MTFFSNLNISRETKELIFLFLVGGLALLFGSGAYGVLETSDARYAEIAREMFRSKDFLHPTLLGIGHFHKPPLTYYVTALGYWLWGVNPFGARFFVQVFVLLQIGLVYRIARQLYGQHQLAIRAAMVYVSFPIVLISSRNLTTDPFLNTFVLLSIYWGLMYLQKQRVIYLYATALAMGLGFLTKGPLIFIVPLVFLIAWSRFHKVPAKIGWKALPAVAFFLLVGGSWFAWVVFENPLLGKYFLGHQVVDRFATDAFHRGKPFWFYLVLAPLVGAPWLLVFPVLLKHGWKELRNNAIWKTLLLSVLIPFVFFSAATSKLVPYILPLYGPWALLIAGLVEKVELRTVVVRSFAVFAVLLGVVAVVAYFVPIPDFRMPVSAAVGAGILLGVVVFLLKSGRFSTGLRATLIPFATALFLLLSSGNIIAYNEIQMNGARPLAEFIRQNELIRRKILVYNRRLSSLAFHLQCIPVSLYDGDEGLNREVQFESDTKWKESLINLRNPDELAQLKKQIDPMETVVIVYKNRLEENGKWLPNLYPHKKDFGKWQIYY